MYVQTHDTHIYIYSKYIINKYQARKIFVTWSFLFNTKTRVFTAESYLLYNNGRFYNIFFLFSSVLIYNEKILTNKTTERPINAPSIMGGSDEL